MKRYILIIAALLMVMLVGCEEKEKQPFTVCVDIDFIEGIQYGTDSFENLFKAFFEKKFLLACKWDNI